MIRDEAINFESRGRHFAEYREIGPRTARLCAVLRPPRTVGENFLRLARKYACPLSPRLRILRDQPSGAAIHAPKDLYLQRTRTGRGVSVYGSEHRSAIQREGLREEPPRWAVELVLEGPDEEMDYIVDSIRERLDSFIGSVDLNQVPATGEFGQFRIQH